MKTRASNEDIGDRAKGFIAGYLIEELLGLGWEVIGIDNLSKYEDVTKSYDYHLKSEMSFTRAMPRMQNY